MQRTNLKIIGGGIKMEELEEIKNKLVMENEINGIGNYFKTLLINTLKPFINKPILNSDFTINKRLKDLLNKNLEPIQTYTIKPLYAGHNAKIQWAIIKSNEYDIYLDISICYNGGDYEDKSYYCIYWRNSYYIASIKDKQIVKFYEELRPLILIKEELEQYLKVKNLKQIFDTENDKLNYHIRVK